MYCASQKLSHDDSGPKGIAAQIIIDIYTKITIILR